ncbi:LysR family transcriptional regulator [Vibrio sp. 10N.261.55.A7]|uniref:LysR substrate-binding domain-containing protein n=1 Tax=Vibrio sp. 10N.261.55.A7 TaxID=1880851 RepID=UPI000C819035|nr:LysR family transcriptional regulator [Vibrio sp. 10N.261.55.A7]PMK04897.1 LysR family transcriptional regulator [Vibrio sp. 10N.261.55.A7]
MSHTNQLLLFLDVVQQGSFTKAAQLHNMDNSALSKQIKKLEAQLGVQLLNRSTRSFSLTSAGEEILLQCQELRDNLSQVQLIADSYQAVPKGRIRITSPIYFGQEYLQPVIAEFIKTYPDVQVIHSLDDKKNDIIADQYDLAFRLGKLNDSNLIAKKVAPTQFIIVASKAFVSQHGTPTTPQELIELPSIVYSNLDVTIDQLTISNTPIVGDSNSTATDEFQYSTYAMKSVYTVSDVRTMVNSARDGVGYALIEVSNLNKSLRELGLVLLLPEYKISTMNTAIYAIYPHRKYTKLTQEFIKSVQTHIGDPPRWKAYLNSEGSESNRLL